MDQRILDCHDIDYPFHQQAEKKIIKQNFTVKIVKKAHRRWLPFQQ